MSVERVILVLYDNWWLLPDCCQLSLPKTMMMWTTGGQGFFSQPCLWASAKPAKKAYGAVVTSDSCQPNFSSGALCGLHLLTSPHILIFSSVPCKTLQDLPMFGNYLSIVVTWNCNPTTGSQLKGFKPLNLPLPNTSFRLFIVGHFCTNQTIRPCSEQVHCHYTACIMRLLGPFKTNRITGYCFMLPAT